MGKPVLGVVLGGVLGVFDGLTALLSAPEVAPQLMGIVIGSTIKGVLAGGVIGWFSRRVRSLGAGLVFGLAVGAFLAFLVALMPDESGNHYYLEIILPGSIVGLIVGYATQRWGDAQTPQRA
jgi:hypothetical protein